MSDVIDPSVATPTKQAVAAPTPRPADHPQVAAGGIGVLLVNLGTPEATDAESVRRTGPSRVWPARGSRISP